jgi:GTP-binding protein
MVRAGQYRSFTVADIPGLIEGAHQGKGLGLQFLRHIERTAVLVFLIDIQSDDPEHELSVLRRELGLYSPQLLDKPWLVCLSKADVAPDDLLDEFRESPFAVEHHARVISAVSGMGLPELTELMWSYVKKQRIIQAD